MVLIGLVSLAIFWGPFVLKLDRFWGIGFGKQGMNVIQQNFDGLNFLVIAKSWYAPELIEKINERFLTGNDPIYFTAHFPAFPGVVQLFDLVLPLPRALLAGIVLSNLLLGISLYWFFSHLTKDPKLALLMSTIGLFFPARMLSVRGVGSNEPLFIFLTLVSIILMMKQKHWQSAVGGALAVLTRSPGIILFVVYALTLWRRPRDLAPYLLMPLTLLGLFGYYGWQHGDWLAYFHSGDNLHLFFPPFQIFSNTASWINDMWREDVIYLYLFYGLGLALIETKWMIIRNWGLLYGSTLLFVAHRDLARYALPIAPIVLFGYAPLIKRIPKKFLYALAVLLIPIYLMGWQFVIKNIQPINDWGVFL